MTKQEVLEIFVKEGRFMTPDAVCRQLRGFHHRCSVYSYLFRLRKQGLLVRQTIYGRIAYQISQRGIARLQFFKSQSNGSQNPSHDSSIGMVSRGSEKRSS
jgi:DNA-binding transcriptional regulator PaaX